MDLAYLSRIRQRTSHVMRLGCCLLCISLLLGLACPIRAHAVVTETAVIALVAAYLACCGYSLAAHDMNASGTSNAIAKMITDFLDTELGGVSISEWGSAWFSAGVAIQSGVAYIPAAAANALAKLANWVKGEYGETPGQEFTVTSDQYFTAVDGTQYALTVVFPDNPSVSGYCSNFQVGTTLIDSSTDFSNSLLIPITSSFSGNFTASYCSEFPDRISFSFSPYPTFSRYFLYDSQFNISFCINNDGYLYVGCSEIVDGVLQYWYWPGRSSVKASDLNINGGSLTMGVGESVSIPLDLADGESLKLKLNNPAIDTPDALTQDVIGHVQAGDLTAEAEIVDAIDVPIDVPIEPAMPDIDGLGLPALGAALTSRFPFSIPWDVAKGVQLLAAPAKAPYWEVDFLAPIAYRVGGWKGDTAFVIDMSEFEIIGQLSRWTSTIGFCLLLASGTKRLIWTA